MALCGISVKKRYVFFAHILNIPSLGILSSSKAPEVRGFSRAIPVALGRLVVLWQATPESG